MSLAIDTIDSIVIKRSSSTLSKQKHKQKKQNLCLDKAYHSKEIEQEITNRGYISHTYDIEENRRKETHQEIFSTKMGS